MAYTQLAAPVIYSSFNDDLIYTVLSDKVTDPITYPNFKYIGDLFVNGVMVARLKKIANPATGIGVFNVSQIVRSYSETLFSPTAAALPSFIIGTGSFLMEVKIEFGEEYNFTEFLNEFTTTTQFYYNTYNKKSQRGTGTPITSRLDMFATNRVDNANVLFSTANYFITFLPYMGVTYTFRATPVLANGLNGTPYTGTLTIGTPYDLQVLDIAPAYLNTLSAGMITSTMRGYKVEVGTLAVFNVTLICEPLFRPYTIHFMNQYGAFDSMIFQKLSRKNFSITKNNFGKLDYTVDESGAVTYKSGYGVYNETTPTYASQFTESLTLNSDFLTDTEYTWLADLMVSPMIYLEEAAEFYPISITDSNYEPKKSVNDGLTNLTITIQFGSKLNAQYR